MNIYEQRCKDLKEEVEFLKRQLVEAEMYFKLIRNAAEDGLDEIHCE